MRTRLPPEEAGIQITSTYYRQIYEDESMSKLEWMGSHLG